MNKSEMRTEMRRRRAAMTADVVAAASAAIQTRVLALEEVCRAAAVFGRGEGMPLAETLDLCIAPGLAFTVDGQRLGQRGGHYDRFLAARSNLTVIGLCYDWQIVDALPSDPTDHLVDAIVTEQRVVRRSPAGMPPA